MGVLDASGVQSGAAVGAPRRSHWTPRWLTGPRVPDRAAPPPLPPGGAAARLRAHLPPLQLRGTRGGKAFSRDPFADRRRPAAWKSSVQRERGCQGAVGSPGGSHRPAAGRRVLRAAGCGGRWGCAGSHERGRNAPAPHLVPSRGPALNPSKATAERALLVGDAVRSGDKGGCAPDWGRPARCEGTFLTPSRLPAPGWHGSGRGAAGRAGVPAPAWGFPTLAHFEGRGQSLGHSSSLPAQGPRARCAWRWPLPGTRLQSSPARAGHLQASSGHSPSSEPTCQP